MLVIGFLAQIRLLIAVLALSLSVSPLAWAGDDLSNGTIDKLAEPTRIAEELSQSETGRVRIIVEFAAPAMPEASALADGPTADAARSETVRQAQDAVLQRVFAVEGGAEAAAETLNLAMTRMSFTPHVAMTVDQALLEQLANDPGVLKIFEDRRSEPMLNESLPIIQMPEAYAAGAAGSSRHVAVLDSGGRRTHKFLNSRITAAACYSLHDPDNNVHSLCPDNVSESTDIDSANDCDHLTIRGCGHGTHVAGIAAGFNPNLLGEEPVQGVARDARIVSINVFHRVPAAECGAEHDSTIHPNGCISAYNSDIQKGLERVYALRHTLDIDAVNLSLGSSGVATNYPCEEPDPLAIAMEMVRAAGIAPVVSAGNSSLYGVGYPACIPAAIAVSSSTKADERSSFSNWGEPTDLVAPGSAIVSSHPFPIPPQPIFDPDTSFAPLNGTSMSAPHVAGAFAALRSVRPNDTVDQILAALKDTGTAIGDVIPGGTTLNKPRINVNDALTELGGSDLQPAEIAVPSPGSTLQGSSETFEWDAAYNATGYELFVGTSLGAFDIHKSGLLDSETLSQTVADLPTDGSTLHVMLYTQLPGDNWRHNRYTYTVAVPALKAEITSPAPGSTLTSTEATFNWTAGTGVAGYWLRVGTNGAGSANIFGNGGAQTSFTVTDLPASGTLNVRLMSYIGSGWQSNDYTYTMDAAAKAVMTSPTPDSTLINTTATFDWTAGTGVAGYWLYVGSNGAGSANIFSGGGAQRTRTLTGLPASGTLNVRLMSYIGGGWQYTDYNYTMNAPTKAVMTWPAPGSTLTNPWTSFTWTAAQGSGGYWLMLGTNGAGSANILSTGVTGTTRSVTGLPQVGTLNVRLMTYAGGGWQYNDYTYTMSVPAMMSSPTPGSTLPGPGVMFQWNGHASIGNYWLYVGTGGAGSGNIFSSGITNTWRYVGGLPASGTVNVRLMSWMGTAWRFRDYTFTAGAGGDALGEEEVSSFLRSISLE